MVGPADEVREAVGQRTVLVVEDDAVVAQLIADALQWQGYAPLLAHAGYEALHLTDGARPVAIILDNRLPDLDGAAFASLYRARTPSAAPILLVTGEADPAAVGRWIGAAAVLGKPFDLDELLSLVDFLACGRAA